MFEIFGRAEKKYNIEKLRKYHRLNGKLYLLLYILVAYFCLDFLLKTKAEPSPRAALHSVFALAVVVLFCLKISFVKIYKQFYGNVKTLGILIALLTFGMIGTSSGYYLLITKLGTDVLLKKGIEEKKEVPQDTAMIVKKDQKSIKKGEEIYESKCFFCHDPHSTKTIVGPGHKGILKNPLLPVSKQPATPENIIHQIKNPYRDMPSFSYLSDDEVLNIIAYLNTL
jgi:hypothetical protein